MGISFISYIFLLLLKNLISPLLEQAGPIDCTNNLTYHWSVFLVLNSTYLKTVWIVLISTYLKTVWIVLNSTYLKTVWIVLNITYLKTVLLLDDF